MSRCKFDGFLTHRDDGPGQQHPGDVVTVERIDPDVRQTPDGIGDQVGHAQQVGEGHGELVDHEVTVAPAVGHHAAGLGLQHEGTVAGLLRRPAARLGIGQDGEHGVEGGGGQTGGDGGVGVHGVHSTAGPCWCQEGKWRERGRGEHPPSPDTHRLGEQAGLLVCVELGDAGGLGLLAPLGRLHPLARLGLGLHAGRGESVGHGLAILHPQGAGLELHLAREVVHHLHGQVGVPGLDLADPEAVAAARLPGLADVPAGVGEGRGDVAVAAGLHGLALDGDAVTRATEERTHEVGGDGLDGGDGLEHGECLSGPEGQRGMGAV